MPRYIRNTVVLAKIETTIGVDAVPTGAANAVLVRNVTLTPLEATNVDRALIRPFLGGSEQLVGALSVKVEMTVELAGSGTAGTAPAWDALLQVCGVAGATAATPSRYEYNPISAALKTATIYIHDDGALHKLLSAMGEVEFTMPVGDIPQIKLSFVAEYGGVTAVANAAPTLTAWKQPQVITDGNSGDVTLGGVYATGAVTGGTAYPSSGIQSLKFGNQVAFEPLLGGDSVQLSAREVTGSLELDLTAAQEVTFMGTVIANTLQSMSLLHGTTAGNQALVFLPSVQLINPKKVDKNGRRLIGFDFRALPVSGNDEVRLVML
ncbi:MAG: hypothetical protein RLY71_426 [Pseudomonadota bacterium]|jgi:hypothetical protein